MVAKYCNADCQRNHWLKHKKECKQQYDEALFKDPPPKEDCPICCLPMPVNLISCISLPPAGLNLRLPPGNIFSVPVYDFAMANEGLASEDMKHYYECCGKSICRGCAHSFMQSGNGGTCPFCKTERIGKTFVEREERVEELRKRVEANDAVAMYVLGTYYDVGRGGLLRDRTKANKLFAKAAELGSSNAHFSLGGYYFDEGGGDLKKAKIHYEAAAMLGHDQARFYTGMMEFNSDKKERAVKHWMIAASAGHCKAMKALTGTCFDQGYVNFDALDSTFEAYNSACAEMRSEARDKYIQAITSLANQNSIVMAHLAF
jgi:TPR repeat protein